VERISFGIIGGGWRVELELRRINAGENGNLEGYHLRGILAGDQWLYENPYAPGRLSDDEIAVATCLERMAMYVAGGPAFYSGAEAAQDHYLSLLMDQAVQTGEPVVARRQPWGSVQEVGAPGGRRRRPGQVPASAVAGAIRVEGRRPHQPVPSPCWLKQ
jgi:hypothetical protein